MRRRVLVAFAALVLAVYAGVYIGSQSPYVDAQGITPAPRQHAEIRTPFFFCVWETPSQIGCRAAEFKDEYGQSFYKVDALPGCGEWKVAPGTQPGLLLTPGVTDCPGFKIDFGVIYWFDTPPISVTPSPTFTPFTATVTPPPGGATATPSPTVVSGATVTPSPPGGTPTPTLNLTGALPGPFSGQLSVNGMCGIGMEIAYVYNIRRDAAGKITSFDKIICTTRNELREIQNFDAIATLDARVPITNAWWLLSTVTPTP